MASTDPMREQLIKLAARLQREGIKLIIGGGYGLILKAEYVRAKNLRTRFPESEVPNDRATNDIDAFMTAEVVTDTTKIEILRDTLLEFGYSPTAKFFQFEVQVDDRNPDLKVKLDLLSPPVSEEEAKLVKINKPRIRPKTASGIHGYLTEEAVTLEEALITFTISEPESAIEIFLPHPFTYLVLKLFAANDRNTLFESEGKETDLDKAKYHAFDIYRIIAMMTELEWDQACAMRDKFAGQVKIQVACDLVQELFGTVESIGIHRLQQHAATDGTKIPKENILNLIKDLLELFPPN